MLSDKHTSAVAKHSELWFSKEAASRAQFAYPCAVVRYLYGWHLLFLKGGQAFCWNQRRVNKQTTTRSQQVLLVDKPENLIYQLAFNAIRLAALWVVSRLKVWLKMEKKKNVPGHNLYEYFWKLPPVFLFLLLSTFNVIATSKKFFFYYCGILAERGPYKFLLPC